MVVREYRLVRNKKGTILFALCTKCHRQFLPEGNVWGQVEDFLLRKFNAHQCQTAETSKPPEKNDDKS